MTGKRTRTSRPQSTGRRLRLVELDDGWVAVGLLGPEDRMPSEVFGPLAPDECSMLACELLVHRPPVPRAVVGAATRLEGLTHASVHLLRLERALRRVTSEDEAPAVDEALDGLRAVFRILAADDATGPSRELAEGAAA